MQGRTEEFEVYGSTRGKSGEILTLVTGLNKVEVARQNVEALSKDELTWVIHSVLAYQSQITAT